MDLKKFDLQRLTILWQCSDSNVELKNLIEDELKIRIQNNTNFSREYLFDVSKIQNHAITVKFIPTTDAYVAYGADVTVDLLLSDAEMVELLENFSAKPPLNTIGQIKARALVTDNMTEEQIAQLEEVGFHTTEILEIEIEA